MRVLDETDSGLDIDALRIVSEGVNRLRSPERAFIVITHYQRLLDYIVPDVVHVLSKGRIVKTGGKELALELEARGYAEYQEDGCASDERRSRPSIKTAAETALAQAFAQARGAAARRWRDRRAARGGLRRIRQGRPAASPRRGLEIHRSARADARGQAARGAARCRRQGAREDGRRACWRRRTRRLVFVDGAFVAELSDIAALEPGLTVGSLADALADGDPTLAAHLGKLAPAGDAAVALNTALMGDGAVIRIAAGATIERPIICSSSPRQSRPRPSCARWWWSSRAPAPC